MQYATTLSSVLPALLLVNSAASAGLDCKNAYVDKVKWNFGELKGQHTLSWAHEHNKQTIYNTTFALDICGTLGKSDDFKCTTGTHVCGVDDIIDDEGKVIEAHHETTDIAGDYLSSGRHTDHKWARLKDSESSADADKEGVRLTLNGGKVDGVPQQASIEFLCAKRKEYRSKRASTDTVSSAAEDDDEDDGSDGDDGDDDHHSGGSHEDLDKKHPEWAKYRETDDGKGGTIKFQSYKMQGTHKILRLEWETPYACEDAAGDEDLHNGDSNGGGWGFFGWFFFLAFWGILIYFAFFAWINYSRHGATGWDMLPHSDTIRDLPYILGDWGRRVVGTVQGGTSRGGYSAL